MVLKWRLRKEKRGIRNTWMFPRFLDGASSLMVASFADIRNPLGELSLGEEVHEYSCTLVQSIAQDQIEMSTMQVKIRRNREGRSGS